MSGEEKRDGDKGEPVKRKRGRPPKAKKVEYQAPAPARAPEYYVADGKSVTSKRGLLNAGEKVKASDFHGGQSRIDQLVAVGCIEAR